MKHTHGRMKHLAGAALAAAALAIGAATAPAPAAHAAGGTEQGWISNGTALEEVADSAPCTPEDVKDAAGEWGKVGPILCFEKPAGTTGWTLDYEWTGCTWHYYLVVGVYGGDCLWTTDEGDYVKVWGSAGVYYLRFTLTWQ